MDEVKEYATQMANLFENHVRYFGGEAFLADDGLNALGDFFQNVDYDLRGPIFELFVQELGDRGIPYDAEQWKVN